MTRRQARIDLVDSRVVNKRVVESLIKSGAMDCFQLPRKQMILQLDRILENSARRERNANQHSLFDAEEIIASSPRLSSTEDYDEQEKLIHEKEALGFYISGHPLQKHKELLDTFTLPIESIDSNYDGKEAILGGIVGHIKQVKTRRGDLMAIIELEDLTGMIEITVFPELYKNNLAHIFTESELIVKGRLDLREESVNMRSAQSIWRVQIGGSGQRFWSNDCEPGSKGICAICD